jgi:ABC-2 type transport system permease protein
MLVELQPVRQTVRTPYHLPMLTFSLLATGIGFGVAVWCNFFYNKVFASTVVVVTTPLLALAYVFSLMFRPDFAPQPIGAAFKLDFWLALGAILVAILVLTAIAIAASTRLSQVLTLAVTMGLFIAGMLSDWFIGRRLDGIRSDWLLRAQAEGLTHTVERVRGFTLISGEVSPPIVDTVQAPLPGVALSSMAEGWEMLSYAFLWIVYAILPNFQRLLLMDALTQSHVIPPAYLGYAALYGFFCIGIAISLAVILFQRREVG